MSQDPIFAGTPIADLRAIVGQMCNLQGLAEWQKHMIPLTSPATEIGEILPMNDPEIDAIDDAHSALKDLDHDAQVRAICYLISRFGLARDL